jgi:peptide chain release factor 2
VLQLDSLADKLIEAKSYLELLEQHWDLCLAGELQAELSELQQAIIELEFKKMFNQDLDHANAFLDIQAGSGGVEAQDWAEMLLRMYSRWLEKRGFELSINELVHGEVAGIKNASIHVHGHYAYGWLRTETGIHRLVRKSPFDANHKRHTSFAAVFIYPEIDEDIEIDINQKDLEITTYRASGAGGQHINKTDSAVRIKHLPTGIVVQSQANRSQHQNMAQCLKQLKAKLYDLELHKQQQHKQQLEDNKDDISWGNQIRSYILDQSRIKDLRTKIETSNTQAVLDGDLDLFILESLKQGT